MIEQYRLVEHNSDVQMRWGSNDDTRKYLTVGLIYDAEVEIHNWHTKLVIGDKKFNVVCFEFVTNNLEQEKKIVEILVKDGHAEPGHIPDGVEVHIKDYDVDNAPEEHLLRDEWGWYILMKW